MLPDGATLTIQDLIPFAFVTGGAKPHTGLTLPVASASLERLTEVRGVRFCRRAEKRPLVRKKETNARL